MADPKPADPKPADPQPGVTRIVKLGVETLLITRIENGQDVPDGEYTINKIEAVPASTATGASPCGGRCARQSICIVRFGVE